MLGGGGEGGDKNLKQEERERMGCGGESSRVADQEGNVFTNFPLGSNPLAR